MMGGLLSGEQISERVRQGELISEESFEPANIRAASYDVRIATDVLRLPDVGGRPRVYPRGTHYTGRIHLKPGDVIFVTSQEEFLMPDDVAANIGVRFALAGQGVLIHTGLLIHPNFGRDRDGKPVPGKRLHFLLANLSPEDVLIERNEKVASLQFFEVDPVPGPKGTEGRDDLEDKYIRDQDRLGLGYLSEVNTVAARASKLEERVVHLDNRFTFLEKSSRDLINFGVFIVAAAVIGVVFSELLSFLQGDRAKNVGRSLDDLHLNWQKTIVIVAMLIVLIVIIRVLERLLKWAGAQLWGWWQRRQ